MPQVAVLMGSDSDLEHMKGTLTTLDSFDVSYDVQVISAHRSPHKLGDYVASAPGQGVKVFIAAAGGAAHLGGVIASLTTLPVIGVPIPTKSTNSLDSILSILQMPSGVPVATVAANSGGPPNAAILAVQMMALGDEGLAGKLKEHKKKLEKSVEEKNARAQKAIGRKDS